MKNPAVIWASVMALMAGCASAPEVQHISSAFDAEHAKAALNPGKNSLKGSGFLRQNGGGVVTCAGATVYLLPATSYAVERMRYTYGSSAGGLNNRPKINFYPDYPEYYQLMRKTSCDAQGNFEFNNVSPGSYFVVTSVVWKVGYSIQGGNLMRPVEVRDGVNSSIVITSN